jgi:hypothetical protein
VWNPRRGGRNDWEGLWPKGFKSHVHGAQFLECFQALSNIVTYDDKTNPSFWLEDYRLERRAGGVDNDLFIIQFLPIYLTDSARAWLDHLPKNMIDNWEDIKVIFTGNF